MLKIPNPLSRLNRIGLAPVLAPLTLGIAMLSAVAPVKAIPVYQGGVYIRGGQPRPVYPNTIIYGAPPSTIIYNNPYPSPYIYSSPSPTTSIYGSPIPSPVPLNQGTGLVYPSNGYYNVNPVVPLPGQVVTPGIYDPFGNNTVIVNPPVYSTNYRGYVNYGYPGHSYGYGTYGYPARTRIYIRN